MLIISDNKKYYIELKELAVVLFQGKKDVITLESEISKILKLTEKQDISKQDYQSILDSHIEILILQKDDIYNTKYIKSNVDDFLVNLCKNYLEKEKADKPQIFYDKNLNQKINIILIKNKKRIYENLQEINYSEKFVYKKLLHIALSKNYQVKSKWGTLTGIRPVKIVNDLKKQGKTNNQIKEELKDKYLISDEKINLITNISDVQDEIIDILKDDISIYISVPFCPSRCNYCSFFSLDIQTGKKYIKDYLKNLEIEISKTLEIPYFKNKNITCIYVGGGTPSSLDEEELEIFFDIIKGNFELDKIREFTFEAGRVDTLNKDKLKIIHKNNVTRISINPQTMNDKTLIKIGREHNVKQVVDIFNIARNIGFDNINMDMIFGLADEQLSDIENSVDKILQLNPESITVHCLARKRSSSININKLKTSDLEISEYMTNLIFNLQDKGYSPYYIYRQKNMLENAENIGFSKKGKYNLYNVAIMDELQSIIAFGVSSSSKIIHKDSNLIKRVANYKDVLLYNNNVDEMIKRKEKVL